MLAEDTHLMTDRVTERGLGQNTFPKDVPLGTYFLELGPSPKVSRISPK